jgi:hypothetical protein
MLELTKVTSSSQEKKSHICTPCPCGPNLTCTPDLICSPMLISSLDADFLSGPNTPH